MSEKSSTGSEVVAAMSVWEFDSRQLSVMGDLLAAVKAQIGPHLDALKNWKTALTKDQCGIIAGNLAMLGYSLTRAIAKVSKASNATASAEDIYYCAFGIEGIANIVDAKLQTFFWRFSKENIKRNLNNAREIVRTNLENLALSLYLEARKSGGDGQDMDEYLDQVAEQEQKDARKRFFQAVRGHLVGISEEEMFPETQGAEKDTSCCPSCCPN